MCIDNLDRIGRLVGAEPFEIKEVEATNTMNRPHYSKTSEDKKYGLR